MPSSTSSWKRTICPCGGSHLWRLSVAPDVQAAVPTCAYGITTAVLFWPALFLAPLVYLGSFLVAKATNDRVCDKCGLVIDHKGLLLRPAMRVPDVNPTTGGSNAELGYNVPAPQQPMPPFVVSEPSGEVIGVPAPALRHAPPAGPPPPTIYTATTKFA